MRKNGILFSTMVMLVTSGAASADNFRSEINISESITKSDIPGHPNALKNQINAFSGTYYFRDVATNNHPLAEAAFLERSNSIGLAYENDRWRNKNSYIGFTVNGEPRSTTEGLTTQTTTSWAAAVNFYIPNSIFYVGGSLSESHFKDRSRYHNGEEFIYWSFPDDTSTSWRLRAGVTPTEGLLVWSEFYKDQELDDEWNINAKYVMDWNGNAVNLEASYDRSYNKYENPHIWSDHINDVRLMLAVDYYLDRTLSLGVTYDRYDLKSWETNYGLRLRKFFTNKFAIDASFMTSDRTYDYKAENYQVGATLRF